MFSFLYITVELVSHPKSPKAKDDDDEINDVGQEHECIDIGGSPVLRVENIPEETLSWLINTLNPAEKSACIKSLHMTFTKAPHLKKTHCISHF